MHQKITNVCGLTRFSSHMAADEQQTYGTFGFCRV